MSFYTIAGRWGGDTEVAKVRIDSSTESLQTIPNEHHEIHVGRSFDAFFENMCTNADEMTVIGLITPDTNRFCHMVFTGYATAIARMAIYENPSIDVNEGGSFTVINRNRNLVTRSGVLSIETVPVANRVTSYNEGQAAAANITKTTPIMQEVVGSGSGKSGSGGAAGSREEFILRRNTQYAFMVESLNDDDNYHLVSLNWYEHVDKHG